MKESTLAKFLSGELNAAVLRRQLAHVVGTSALQTGRNLITDLSFDFALRKDHLILLCEAVLKGDLDSDELRAIAYFLQASVHFVWDTDCEDGELIGETLGDWSAPE